MSIGADVAPVNMDLAIVGSNRQAVGLVVDLSPAKMTLLTPVCLRAGARFLVTLKLPNQTASLFALVKKTSFAENGAGYNYRSELTIIGATREAVIAVVKFLAAITKTNKILGNS